LSIKGAREYRKFREGKRLSRKQAILAQCYECNGFKGVDCGGKSCPLYQWSPYVRSREIDVSKAEKLHLEHKNNRIGADLTSCVRYRTGRISFMRLLTSIRNYQISVQGLVRPPSVLYNHSDSLCQFKSYLLHLRLF
jgi:hypothetical protein